MSLKAKLTKEDLLHACAILVALKDFNQLLPSEIQRKSQLTREQTERLLKLLEKNLYVIPRTVPEGNKILAKYGISRRGMEFLEDTLIDCGLNQKVTFSLYGKELNEALKFMKNHPCKYKSNPRTGGESTGAIGGKISYRFTPTSIGVAVTVLCSCGKEENITDYDSW